MTQLKPKKLSEQEIAQVSGGLPPLATTLYSMHATSFVVNVGSNDPPPRAPV